MLPAGANNLVRKIFVGAVLGDTRPALASLNQGICNTSLAVKSFRSMTRRLDNFVIFCGFISALKERPKLQFFRAVEMNAGNYPARFRCSFSFKIIGVKINCIANSCLPPGTTIQFARDINES